ncbi:Na/Pi cotransporter family protein [Desulfuribacillus alkaliarsenatis]|uniref:Na/Pi cotransporter n=1 Tax=Desulfuribacillus alkaliarsenatis TaxID=766136 RepID=A0A1E5G086_9FIRM|nr:Na/Pi symporter [Desulfuribacillus alkaliarsenatis]OEF96232.1 hypothetical protein BHF68_08690 [Desulfuribacillus alkaliarsenatis]
MGATYSIVSFILGFMCLFVGLFLLRWALQSLIGNKTENILTTLTNSPMTGVLTGILLTTILQSSSIVLIVILNLVSVGALPILNAVAIVLGANLGTSLTLEFIAFSNPSWVYILIIVSSLFYIFKKRLQSAVFLALGLLLVGFEFLKRNASILDGIIVVTNNSILENTFALLAGIIFTAIVQSSTASTTFVMTLVENQLLTLVAGVLFVYGSNIGTCITSVIAVIGASIHAKKIMLYHVAINILCVVILLPIVPLLVAAVEYITPNAAQQIAHSQVIFNLLTIVIFYPFIRKHIRLLNKIYN